MNYTVETQTIPEVPMQSTSIGKLAEALAKAQGAIHGALKDSANPFFKSKYADLASIIESCRDALSVNNICVFQTTTIIDGKLYLETMLAHSSDQWKRGLYPVRPVKDDPQGIGSALTYARRYGLAAAVGVAQVDDDGEAAMGRKAQFADGDMKPAGHDIIDRAKLDAAIIKAIEIVDSDDMDTGPQAARDLLRSLTNGELVALKKALEIQKGGKTGKKSYYSMFLDYKNYKPEPGA